MSAQDTIPEHYKIAYGDNCRHALQQKHSKIRKYVTVSDGSGEAVAPIDFFGNSEAEEDKDRFGDTPNNTPDQSRLWAFPYRFHWGTLLERSDHIKQMRDPTSKLVQSGSYAMARFLDYRVLLPAFFGITYWGRDLGSAVQNPVVFDTAKHKIDVNIGGGGSATGLNVEKVQALRKKFMENEVDLDMEDPVMLISPDEWEQLFNDVKAVNGDYVNGRPLETGDIPGLLKFRFVISNHLQSDGTNRRCPAWVPSGIELVEWDGLKIKGGEDPNKKFNNRVYMSWMAGATRTEAGKVLECPCKIS